MSRQSLVIGVDFDNTIAGYDGLMRSVAREMGLAQGLEGLDKKAIRDAIRSLLGGERRWMEAQAQVYGPRMGQAKMIDGVREFFARAKESQIKVFIISHKTDYAAADEKRETNLRAAALEWMDKMDFFTGEGLALSRDDVFFEPTRAAKIERISLTGCTHFIDDLEEVFEDGAFPGSVEKILYAPGGRAAAPNGVMVFGEWERITSHIFNGSVAP